MPKKIQKKQQENSKQIRQQSKQKNIESNQKSYNEDANSIRQHSYKKKQQLGLVPQATLSEQSQSKKSQINYQAARDNSFKKQKNYIKQQKVPSKYNEINVLKTSGLLDAYQHFLKLLIKHGLPQGKVFDYAAQQIQKYEKKKINKQLKMKAQLQIQKIAKKKLQEVVQQKQKISPYHQK